jgi:acyl-CoA synthetase (AMP-forming)/AMP-acid ligase II
MSFYLTQALHRSLQQRPDAIATIFNARRQTWAQFGERVARFAGVLREHGIRSGERVALGVWGRDSAEQSALCLPCVDGGGGLRGGLAGLQPG